MEPYGQLFFVGVCLFILVVIFWPKLPDMLTLFIMLFGATFVATLASA